MDPSLIQTPPPTRDSSRRKLAPAPGHISTPATVVGRSASTPTTADGFFSQTPVQFPSLPFSPEAVQFPNAGPASAPAFAQNHNQYYWDHSNVVQSGDVDMTNIPEDPFGPTPHRPSEPFVWPFASPNPQASPQFFNPETAALHSHMAATAMPVSNASPTNFSFSQADSFVTTTSGVDPNMIFSFQQDTNASFNQMLEQQKQALPELNHNRQPYEHQTQESLREREEARKSRQGHSRTSTSSSLSQSSSGLPRPGLQRSKTDGGSRVGNGVPQEIQSAPGQPHIPRRSSPLKRPSVGLNTIPEFSNNRSRTRLVIDENGRARTETDPSPAEPTAQRDARYPGLWSDDESGSDNDRPVLSRPGSFVFDPPARRSSKHGRMDSMGRSASVKKARPASMIALDNSFFEKPAGASGRQQDLRRSSLSSFSSGFGSTPTKAGPSNAVDPAGDAQNALKRVVEGRMKRQGIQHTTHHHTR